MSAISLESALKAHAISNRNAALLHAQWEFDHRLLTQALGSVGAWFPHYSLHDGSHSSTIITQIERVLGPKRIEQLSPTDLWLILESAYWHDSGMLVSEPSARKLWLHEETRTRLESWRTSRDDERRENAQLLLAGPNLKNPEWPFEVRRRLILAISELRRPEHASMSGGLVRSPEDMGIDSPRTALIPRRLLELLARIVEGHGRSLAWVMQRLPQRESGLGTDEAHPRLVACLLRIGDLLDLDDGRFCPTMAATFGALPDLSRAHERKHTSIQHLLVDSTRIEVTAVCDDFESYEVTSQWLSMLEDEIKSQAGQWSDISVGPAFGALPSAGTIAAQIRGGITLANGERPRFRVDAGAVRELAKGTNLYKDSSVFIRELLQNAVDASHLRMYVEHRSELDPDSQRPLDASIRDPLQWMRKKLGDYPIEVRVSCSDTALRPSREVDVAVTISDQGTGIARSDLTHLLTVMSGVSGPAKARSLAGMPEWLLPSGAFGIGIQSAFLVTDAVHIDTFHFETLERMSVTLRRDGAVEAREGTREFRARFGTTVSFNVTVPLIGAFQPTEHAQQWMDAVDILASDTHKHPPLQVGEWLDAIQIFSQSSTVPVRWRFEYDGVEIASSSASRSAGATDVRAHASVAPSTWRLLVETEGRLFTADFHDVSPDGVGEIAVYYRGTLVDRHASFPDSLPCDLSIDLYFGTSRDLLVMDRTKLSMHGRNVLHNEIIRDLMNRIDIELELHRSTVPSNILPALELSAKVRGKAPRFNDWSDFLVMEHPATRSDPSSTNKVSLGDLIKTGNLVLCTKNGQPTVWCDGKFYKAGGAPAKALALALPVRERFSWGTRLTAGESRVSSTIQSTSVSFSAVGNRRVLACPIGYAGLAIQRKALSGWPIWGWLRLFDSDEELMLSPFVGGSLVSFRFNHELRPQRLSDYVHWTAKHSARETPKAEIADLTWRYICEISRFKGLDPSALEDARRELLVFEPNLPDGSSITPKPEPQPPWHEVQ